MHAWSIRRGPQLVCYALPGRRLDKNIVVVGTALLQGVFQIIRSSSILEKAVHTIHSERTSNHGLLNSIGRSELKRPS